MKAKIIHVLCEGQTEQGFVEEVLRPYLQAQGVAGVKSILITTNKKKNARGGMLSYAQAVTDLELLRKMKMDGEYERHVFTTKQPKQSVSLTPVSQHWKRRLLKQSTIVVSFPIFSCMNLKLCSFAVLTIWQSVTPVVRNAANS
mgnify:CR=1 FL=1